MNLEEWEILPKDGFLEIHDDGGKKIYSRKLVGDPQIVLNMNYFMPPSPNSRKIVNPPGNPPEKNRFFPVPIDLEKVKVITDSPIVTEKVKVETDDHQHTVSQVFFNKTKENEFVDMKMDSPKSSGWGIAPPIDAGNFQFEDSSESVEIGRETEAGKNRVEDSKENGGMSILKWSLNGIGAICSFGVAAATICIIILGNGNQQRNKQQNQKIRFQIYADEKRMKEVAHHATKWNEAMSAVRGRHVPLSHVPLTTAHFTFGGYYDHHAL